MEEEKRRLRLADLYLTRTGEYETWSDKDDFHVRAKLVLYEEFMEGEPHYSQVIGNSCEFMLRYLKYKRYHESESFKSLWSDPPDGYKREEWMNRYGDTPQILDDEDRPTTAHGCAQRVCDYLRIPFLGLISA